MKILLSLLLASSILAAPVHAQSAKALVWPKTFSGQPDFVFIKADVVKEALTKAKEEGAEPPTSATLDDVLNAQTTVTPLQLEAPNPKIKTDDSSEVSSVSISTPAQQDATLPDVLADALLDVSEFKAVLETAAHSAVRKARVNLKKYDFRADLARLTLQAVVRSPNKYAIINQHRYTEGDRLHITVPVQINADDIKMALNAHMPPQSALPPERYAQYVKTRDEVMTEFNTEQNAGNIKRSQRVAVKIKRIESRKVILNIDGKDYDLEIKYRL